MDKIVDSIQTAIRDTFSSKKEDVVIPPTVQPVVAQKREPVAASVSQVVEKQTGEDFHVYIENENILLLFSGGRDIQPVGYPFMKNQPKQIVSKRSIYKDDTIEEIKAKIFDELVKIMPQLSYKEIFLMASIEHNHDIQVLFEDLAGTMDGTIGHEIFIQIARNFGNNIEELNEKFGVDKAERIDFLQFKTIQTDEMLVPLGYKIVPPVPSRAHPMTYELIFPVVPQTMYYKNDQMRMAQRMRDTLYSVGRLRRPFIAVSLESHVLEEHVPESEMYKWIQETYFSDREHSADDIESLLMRNDAVVPFYETDRLRRQGSQGLSTKPVSFLEQGIEEVVFTIRNETEVILPLQIVFNKLHVSKTIPFIKWNDLEPVVRLYSEQTAQDSGKQVPYLSKSKVSALCRQNTQDLVVYLYDEMATSSTLVVIRRQGVMEISFKDTKKARSLANLNELLKKQINAFVQYVNEAIQDTGFSFPEMMDLERETDIKIKKMDMKISAKYPIHNENIQIKQLQSVFSILQDNITDDTHVSKRAELMFRRVSNYNIMREIRERIRLLENQSPTNRMNGLNEIKRHYHLTDSVVEEITREEWRTKDEMDKYVFRQKKKGEQEPGVLCSLEKDNITQRLHFHFFDIPSAQLIPLLGMYTASFLEWIQMRSEGKSLPPEWEEKLNQERQEIEDEEYIPLYPEEEEEVEDLELEEEEEEKSSSLSSIQVPEPEQESLEQESLEEEEESLEPSYEEEESDLSNIQVPHGSLDKEEEKNIGENTNREEETPLFLSEDKQSSEDEVEIFQATPSEETTPKSSEDEVEIFQATPSEETTPKSQEEKPMVGGKGEPFLKQLQEADPEVFGEKSRYSVSCQKIKQPKILTDEEKQNIDAVDAKLGTKSYAEALTYRGHNYICPIYWNTKENRSMSVNEVQSIPNVERYMIDGMKDYRTEKNEGRYIYQFGSKDPGNKKEYPGFMMNKKGSNGICFPCCFDNSSKKAFLTNKKTCLKTNEEPVRNTEQESIQEGYEEEGTNDVDPHFVKQEGVFPLEKNRVGKLPPIVVDAMKLRNPLKESQMPLSRPFYIRFGLEYKKNQTFLACFADIYTKSHDDKRNINRKQLNGITATPGLHEFKKILRERISLDKFVHYQNGSLPSIFRPDPTASATHTPVGSSDYVSTLFAKSLDLKDVRQKSFFDETVAAYENFRRFLVDEEATIDHHFLWDAISVPDNDLIPEGVNLVIMEMDQEQISILCPPNLYSSESRFDPGKKTVVLLRRKQEGEYVYEPIYRMTRIKKRGSTLEKMFLMKEDTEDMSVFLKQVEGFLKKCGGQDDSNKWLAYSTKALLDLFHEKGYQVLGQVVQNNFCVGFKIANPPQLESIFVPCIRSSLVPRVQTIPVKERPKFAKTYQQTLKRLSLLKNTIRGIQPKAKIADRASKRVLGFVLENEMYVPILPSIAIESIKMDHTNIPISYSMDYFDVEEQIFSNKKDEKRLQANLILLENNFYRLFVVQVRQQINRKENAVLRKQLLERVQDKQADKQEVIKLLKQVAGDYATFQEMDPGSIQHIAEIHSCQVSKGATPVQICIETKDGSKKYVFPRTHLVDRTKNNETAYMTRFANELIQNPRIRKMILLPQYLFYKDSGSTIEKYENEIILLENELNAYFDSLIHSSYNHPTYNRQSSFQYK